MSTKKLVIIALAILLIAAVCLLPWPTRINVQMTGVEFIDGSAISDTCNIRLTGWKLNYLFRDDTVKLDVNISGSASLELNGLKHVTLYNKAFEEYDYASWGVYLSETNQMNSLALCLSKDSNWLAIRVADRYFVASADSTMDPLTCYETCINALK